MTPPLLLSVDVGGGLRASLLPVGDLPKLILEIVAGVAVYLRWRIIEAGELHVSLSS
jgi:hypothetical protein